MRSFWLRSRSQKQELEWEVHGLSLSIWSQGLSRPSAHGPVLASLQQSEPGYVDCSLTAGDLKSVCSRGLVNMAWSFLTWRWHCTPTLYCWAQTQPPAEGSKSVQRTVNGPFGQLKEAQDNGRPRRQVMRPLRTEVPVCGGSACLPLKLTLLR